MISTCRTEAHKLLVLFGHDLKVHLLGVPPNCVYIIPLCKLCFRLSAELPVKLREVFLLFNPTLLLLFCLN